MNCTYFSKHIDLLFDPNTPKDIREQMIDHMKQCPACTALYRHSKAALDAVTPRGEIHAPTHLKERILRTAAQETPSVATAKPHRRRLRPLVISLSAAAMIALALFVIYPMGSFKANAAERLFHNAAALLENSRSFHLEMDVRTLPAESFAYTDPREPFVRHRMWVEPATGRWRLEKEGRVALNNGSHVLLWNPDIHTGSIHPFDAVGVIEDFSILLDPYTMLLREEARAAARKDITYTKQVDGKTIILSANVPAAGDFSNDYMRNSSVGESDTRREYRFDRATGRLTGIKIIFLSGKQEKTLAQLSLIEYDTPLDDALFTAPEGIAWNDLIESISGTRFADITPEEAARKLFAAMQTWNEEVLSEGMHYFNLDRMKQLYAGCRLIEMKEHFRSGEYAGVFVPCLVRMSNGKNEKIILALRNDNPTHSWVADGGL